MAYVLVCGDREWDNFEVPRRVLGELPAETIIVHGNCRGADKIAGQVARYQLGLRVIPVPADWQQYGKAAGAIRNQKMLDDYPISRVIGFHDRFDESKGTKDMVDRAERAAIPCEVFLSNGERYYVGNTLPLAP